MKCMGAKSGGQRQMEKEGQKEEPIKCKRSKLKDYDTDYGGKGV